MALPLARVIRPFNHYQKIADLIKYFLNFPMIFSIIAPPTGTLDLAAASRVVLLLSSTTAAFLPILGGGTDQFPAPAYVSGGIPSAYHAAVVSVIFTFAFSFSAAFLEKKPQAAKISRLTAIACLSSATVLFLYAVFVGGASV